MKKLLIAQLDNSLSYDTSQDCESLVSGVIDLSCKKSFGNKNISSCVKYINDFNLSNIVINDELADRNVYEIATQLAKAIDKNSVADIKRIKQEFGHTIEFASAKEFLNKKCKQIWDVFENKHCKMNIPQQAMRALGITNKPSLEFLLDNSLDYYEKDNTSITVDIIKSTISNPNMDYTFEDILDYLKKTYVKRHCKFNIITLQYLAKNLGYDEKILRTFGISKAHMAVIFVSLPLKEKLKFILKQFCFRIS